MSFNLFLSIHLKKRLKKNVVQSISFNPFKQGATWGMTLCKQIISMMISCPMQTAWHKLHKKPKMAIWDQRNTGRNCHDRDWKENRKVIVLPSPLQLLDFTFSLQKDRDKEKKRDY